MLRSEAHVAVVQPQAARAGDLKRTNASSLISNLSLESLSNQADDIGHLVER